MLTVTPGAMERLTHKLTRKKAAVDEAMRFTRRTGGWTLSVDKVRGEDITFSHGGRCILLLDKEVAQSMDHIVLDARSTATGSRLTLSRQVQNGGNDA